MSNAVAEEAARQIMNIAHESGAGAYFAEIYGPGAVYRAFEKHHDLEAFTANPSIDDDTTYLTGQRVDMCGDLAMGAVSAAREGDLIVVVDDVEQQTRTTLSRLGQLGGRPLTVAMELVPCHVEVESLPAPLDEERRVEVTSRVQEYIRQNGASETRVVYFIDAQNGSSGEIECVTLDEFEQSLGSLIEDGEQQPSSLTRIRDLAAAYDLERQAVVWLRRTRDTDDAWIIAK